jgi:hypothetical protein
VLMTSFTLSGPLPIQPISNMRPDRKQAGHITLRRGNCYRWKSDSTTLLQLLKGRRLCASDIRCLDCESKRCPMRLLLRAYAQDMDENDPKDHHLITG